VPRDPDGNKSENLSLFEDSVRPAVNPELELNVKTFLHFFISDDME
jgi:hypothetical protein